MSRDCITIGDRADTGCLFTIEPEFMCTNDPNLRPSLEGMCGGALESEAGLCELVALRFVYNGAERIYVYSASDALRIGEGIAQQAREAIAREESKRGNSN